ncbi:MAG: hypothetical protein WC895_01300 [Candidatus Shapirobacteria bacterium]|jgi:hypothetical protein
MTDFLNKYLIDINQKIENNSKQDWKTVLKHHRVTIKFLQHERLIHLLVTLAFGIKFLIAISFTLVTKSMILFAVDILLLSLLVPYLFHYFKLENGVQKLYLIDKLIQKKIGD